jgi:hypothetical protein
MSPNDLPRGLELASSRLFVGLEIKDGFPFLKVDVKSINTEGGVAIEVDVKKSTRGIVTVTLSSI